jgi:hypothetical protein
MHIEQTNNAINVENAALTDFFSFFEGFVDSSDHVKRLLWQVVTLAVHNHLETTDGFGQWHVFTW